MTVLTPDLISEIQKKYHWSEEEIQLYLEGNHLHLFENCEEAILNFLNVSLHEAESLYSRLTQIPLKQLTQQGVLKSCLDVAFEELTADYGDVLDYDNKRYYLIFKE